MMKSNIVVLSLLLALGCVAQLCPASNYKGTVFSIQIQAALNGGLIPLDESQDSVCYNYSLPYSFNSAPRVAVAVHSFESDPSTGLYFYIKPLHSDSLSFIPFALRAQWPYTKWTQISFSFIAEDRLDLEAGYYQIDSGSLAGCDNGKSISVLLPFTSDFGHAQIKHNVFLHGFQIATQKIDGNSRSPFEIQILSSSANVSGIAVTLAVTTTTQVNSIFISYIAFQNSNLGIVGGAYVYDLSSNPSQSLFYAPDSNIPRNYARLYGFTGFLLNYNKFKISFNTAWDGFSFSFNIGTTLSSLQYLSFSYIFFTGSECQDCIGYSIYYNNNCLNTCPVGTYKTNDNTCINCGTGRQWNGSACVTSCPVGQYLNPTTNNCECPPTLNWNGQSCIPCLTGKVWSTASRSCECPKPLSWNGYACAKVDICSNGKVWDVYTYSCQCPQSTYWNGQLCKNLPQCSGGQIIDRNYECSCQTGYVWSINQCIFSPCVGGQIWTGSKCVCPAGLNFNGSMCLQCINGQKWNSTLLACACDSGYKWNGQYCEISFSCSNGRVWNAIYQQCICPDKYYWSGYTCLAVADCPGGQYFDSTINKCACLSGYQWNGRICVQCNGGRTWNVTSLTCTCPPGTNQTKTGCQLQQQCTGGKQWNQNSWCCECPATSVWNGAYCIANACSNGRVWNDSLKACQCIDNKVWVNDSCYPAQIACTNGQVWNQYIYACECPQGTYTTVSACVPIPICNNGKVYNPLSNICQCPFGLVQSGASCKASTCPAGQYWTIKSCQVINCPPPSYFLNGRCVYNGNNNNNNCDFAYYWNGQTCVYNPVSCPSGTTWNTSTLTCQNSGQCGYGYYLGAAGNCLPLPQQCAPPTQWDGLKCSVSGSGCPTGTYSQGSACLPYSNCTNGYVWDSTYLRCLCPSGTINTGIKCIQCSNDQKYLPTTGCSCPDGTFDSGANCQSPNNTKCSVISNSIWSDGKCQCRPGFTKVGYQCVCYGTQTGDLCDRCSYKPNSQYVSRSNTCECKTGYVQIQGQCVLSGSQTGNDNPTACSVGTFFQKNSKMCLACPDGCLSCSDCYKCNVCRPEFIYDTLTQKCVQLCGDGKRFFSECDDGNNVDGDGCSRDCKVESGYTCTGGSPRNKDNCYVFRPTQVSIDTIGQIRKTSSVIINVKLNYFPSNLLQSADCTNKCNQILVGTITQGDKSAVSITSQYLTGTQYIFTITVEFGRPYIAKFKLNVNVGAAYTKYFGAISIKPADITIEPSYLSAVRQDSDTLS